MIVSPLLDIIDVYPKFAHKNTCPVFDPEIKFEDSEIPKQLTTFALKSRRIKPSGSVIPDAPIGFVPTVRKEANPNEPFAPTSEGNKMGTPEQILQATYVRQLQPADVNMSERTNETGVYPYFMNKLDDIERMIRNKPVEEPVREITEPSTSVIEQMESAPPMMGGDPMELEEKMKRSPKNVGGRPPLYNFKELSEKNPEELSNLERRFLKREIEKKKISENKSKK